MGKGRGGEMKLFRHICLFGNVYDMIFSEDFISPEKMPKECPEKQGCDNHWDEIDLSQYPNWGPFVIWGVGHQEKRGG